LWQQPPATVHTKSFVLAQTVAQTAVDNRSIAGFFGAPGTGKTYALRHYCATSEFETLYVTASPSPQRKEIYEEILLATVGSIPKAASARALRWHCEEVLAERPRVLVVDECQHLRHLWHQQLRSLHDHQSADFALLLVGGTNARTTLKRDPQLWSRVAMRVSFEALEGVELENVLHELHPVLANTESTLLADIDRRDCRGNLRNWATFLELALPLVGASLHKDRLTTKVVRAVFALREIR
jgi:DNA transposition AAA+ family ATPase